MTESYARRLLVIGGLLLVAGWVFPFLMVIHVIEASLWLSFLSWGISVGGLFTGLIGAALYVTLKRK